MTGVQTCALPIFAYVHVLFVAIFLSLPLLCLSFHRLNGSARWSMRHYALYALKGVPDGGILVPDTRILVFMRFSGIYALQE